MGPFFLLQVRKNVLDVSYHISQYQNIISDLRGEIGRLKEKIQSEAVFGGPSSGVKKAELQEMREQMASTTTMVVAGSWVVTVVRGAGGRSAVAGFTGTVLHHGNIISGGSEYGGYVWSARK